MMPVRSFNADLAMSESPEVVQAIKAACRDHWPELLGIVKAHKLNDQIGVDYWLEFQGGMEALDVKIRRDDYSLPSHGAKQDNRTACLELLSNIGTGKPGWTVDTEKLTDWVMFYYIESGAWCVYNARELRAAVLAYLPELKRTGKPGKQATGGYESGSLFVSHRDLWAAIYKNGQHRRDPMAQAA